MLLLPPLIWAPLEEYTIMSALYHNEEGRVIPTLCEELTRFRRAKVTLFLPLTGAEATPYILAKADHLTNNPLHIHINGINQKDILPETKTFYKWYTIPIPMQVLQKSANTVVLWTDTSAMTGWSLAMEAGHPHPRSAVSDDAGESWRSHRMGYLNAIQGEYCVRIRLAEGTDADPPDMIWENPAHPRVEALRQIIPPKIGRLSRRMDQVRALASWISMSWEHVSSGRAAQYSPWDAETILSWGAAQSGHSGQRPIAMCVHYAVAFVSACQALGIPARSAVLTGTPNGSNGHFVAEVWFEEHQKWVMVDPNCDAILFKDHIPLSISEIQGLGNDLAPYVSWGQGTVFQRTFSHMRDFIRDNFLKGICFTHRSIWPRSDFLSHPEFTPPGHGSVSYCETDLVWTQPDLPLGFGMFRYFAPQAYFDQSPFKTSV